MFAIRDGLGAGDSPGESRATTADASELSGGDAVKRYIVERVVQALLALVLLSFVVFITAHATGDPARYLLPAERSTAADLEHMRLRLGLDKPLIVQYGLFLVNAAQGDLGTSFTQHRPVSELLMQRLPATIELAVTALVVSVLIGVPLGVLAALRRNSITDRLVRFSTILSMAAPHFWVGIMLITLFAAHLHWLPAYGRGGPANLILPVLTLALHLVAGMVRLTRASMLEVLDSDFVRFARMKGLSHWRVTWKHALKNALIPVITFTGIMLGALLNGTIVVEQVFAWPGLGRLTLEAVLERDFPLLQGAVLLGGFSFIVSAFMVDILYAYVDPRIRHQ